MNDAFVTEYAWAFDRARAKSAVVEALRALPGSVQEEILIELIAEMRAARGGAPASTGSAQRAASSAKTPEPPAPPVEGLPKKKLPFKVKKGAARRGRPKRRGKQAVPGRTETLIAVLRSKPGISISELSMEVYGDASGETTAKTRSLLHALKKQGKVQSRGAGQWEVAAA